MRLVPLGTPPLTKTQWFRRGLRTPTEEKGLTVAVVRHLG